VIDYDKLGKVIRGEGL